MLFFCIEKIANNLQTDLQKIIKKNLSTYSDKNNIYVYYLDGKNEKILYSITLDINNNEKNYKMNNIELALFHISLDFLEKHSEFLIKNNLYLRNRKCGFSIANDENFYFFHFKIDEFKKDMSSYWNYLKMLFIFFQNNLIHFQKYFLELQYSENSVCIFHNSDNLILLIDLASSQENKNIKNKILHRILHMTVKYIEIILKNKLNASYSDNEFIVKNKESDVFMLYEINDQEDNDNYRVFLQSVFRFLMESFHLCQKNNLCYIYQEENLIIKNFKDNTMLLNINIDYKSINFLEILISQIEESLNLISKNN
jgi:hypothetical protein